MRGMVGVLHHSSQLAVQFVIKYWWIAQCIAQGGHLGVTCNVNESSPLSLSTSAVQVLLSIACKYRTMQSEVTKRSHAMWENAIWIKSRHPGVGFGTQLSNMLPSRNKLYIVSETKKNIKKISEYFVLGDRLHFCRCLGVPSAHPLLCKPGVKIDGMR